MHEIEQYMKRAKEKYIVGKNTLNIGYFGDSISSFYYSMLFAANALLVIKNDNSKTHKETLIVFGKKLVLNDDFDKNIAKYLSQTETLRDKVDYDAFVPVSENLANKKKRQCEEFLRETNRILKKYNLEEFVIDI